MAYNFHECDRDQPYLLPPSLNEWLPQGDLAWFLLDAVDEMDLAAFYNGIREDGWGGKSYPPEMMVALLLYAYCVGERSSRRIEWLSERDVAFRVITTNQRVDHTTIARFRKKHPSELDSLFADVLVLCAQAGLVKVGTVALDGTKMKGNASLAANRSYEHIAAEVKRMLAEAEAVDEEEDRLYGKDKRGDELPEELRDRASRRARLKECKERLEKEALEKAKKQEEKLQKRQEEIQATGQEKRGRKPKDPDPNPTEEAKANVTDPDSRILKTRQGHVQGYNAQAVTTMEQIIVAADVTQQANDMHQLHPMIEQARQEVKAAGIEEEIENVLADAGYCSEENLENVEEEGPEFWIATTKDWKQKKAMKEQPPPRGRMPQGISRRQRMERKMLTVRGRALYKKRSQTVEPVFGQIKEARRCDRFLQRGLEAVRAEWKLLCTAHNLLKLWRSGRAVWA